MQIIFDLMIQTIEECTLYELSLLELSENNILDLIKPVFNGLACGIEQELQVISMAAFRLIGALSPILKRYPVQAELCSQR